MVDRQIDLAELFRFVRDHVPATATAELKLDQQPTWAFADLAGIPRVIALKRPDRPSDLVPLKAMPLSPQPAVLANVLDTIARFPEANPRNNIGLTKWVIQNAPPNSALLKSAQAHLDRVDQMILEGKIQLAEEDDESR